MPARSMQEAALSEEDCWGGDAEGVWRAMSPRARGGLPCYGAPRRLEPSSNHNGFHGVPVMPSFTLKDVPPKLLEDLRRSAAADRRSVTQQVIYLLERALAWCGDAAGSPRAGYPEAVAERVPNVQSPGREPGGRGSRSPEVGGLLGRGRVESDAPADLEAQLAVWRELAGRWVSARPLEEDIDEIVGRRTEGRSVDL